jgi:branched-chain amino acid transport system substrate-binding protein
MTCEFRKRRFVSSGLPGRTWNIRKRAIFVAGMVAGSDLRASVEFGRFRVVPHRRELLADGQPAKLGGRAFDVLMTLIEARGAVVSKDALMARVWPDRVVEENNLQSHISALRAVLGPDRDLIRTVSGRGYQFIGKIRAFSEAGDERASFGPEEVESGAPAPTNMPEPVSELIGRDDELAEVVDLMGAHRLVTLTGAGGIGKTRLAVALARKLRPHFADGVWLAEFSRDRHGVLVSAANSPHEEFPMPRRPANPTLTTGTAVGRRRALAGVGAAVTLPLLRRHARAVEPVTIGWVGPLSPPGGYAEGTSMKNAAILAAEEINKQGGILGRPVEITYADSRGMPAEGRSAAERLVQQNKAVAVFGEFHSPVALAEMEVFHKYGMPFMACDVWSDQITAKGYPEVFRNAPAVSLIDVAIAQWMVAAGFKNVAIIAEKDDAGLASRTIAQRELEKAGVKYTAVDADPNLTDFTAQILRFKSASPPFDFFISFYPSAGAYPMIRQSKDLGFAPTPACGIYNSGGEAVDPTFWQNVGDAGQYLVTENVGLPKSAWNDKTKAFVAAYKARSNGADPSGAVMESYDGAWLLFDSIKRAGNTEGRAIIKSLETTSYVGVRGKYSFSTSHEPAWHYHQFLNAPLTLLQYSEVRQSQADAPIVWPKKFATVPYLYKKPGA